MKLNRAVLAGLLAAAPLSGVALARTHVNHHATLAPTMTKAEADDMDAALRASAFTELSEDAIESVVSEMLSLLEKQGLNYENPEHINSFISFMQTMQRGDGKSTGAKFLDELKKMATKAWHETKGTMKEMLISYVKNLLKAGLKHALPHIEKLNEKAMLALPMNLRVALSPVYFNMWLKLFEKAKLRIPADYKIENFVCKNIDKEQCDEIISKVQGTWNNLSEKPASKAEEHSEKSTKAIEDKPEAASRKAPKITSLDDDFDFEF
uniref:Uncharacterized protein n=2 Tax=Babesia bovis TaxID=5865 RepID=S6CAP6_BABBO|nr:hypothetical protein [Babesia bovis]